MKTKFVDQIAKYLLPQEVYTCNDSPEENSAGCMPPA